MSTPSDIIPPSAPLLAKRRYLNYFNILCGIVTLASFAFGIYWYFQSKQERAPTYYVSPARARIVDTSIPAPPQLQVLYKGKELSANVSAIIVYLWNDGKLPIRSEDVLDPVHIQLETGCAIIDARILKVSRAVTKFEKGDVSETAKNLLPVTFGILEHDDGAVVQIIYAGSPEARAAVVGTIVGSGSPREVFSQQPRVISRRRMAISSLLAAAAITAILGVAIAFLARVRRKRGRPIPRRELLGLIAALGLYVLLISYLAYDTYRSSQPVVPSTIWIHQ